MSFKWSARAMRSSSLREPGTRSWLQSRYAFSVAARPLCARGYVFGVIDRATVSPYSAGGTPIRSETQSRKGETRQVLAALVFRSKDSGYLRTYSAQASHFSLS